MCNQTSMSILSSSFCAIVMNELVGFCVLCFVIVDFLFWLICCKWVWIILMGSVLASLCSHGGVCERYVRILDWVTPCELLSRLRPGLH